jgi:TPR repeat protein
MINTKLIRAAAIALFVTASGFATASTEAWEHADREYQANHFANALQAYEQLAAGGDARAAELAGHMLVAGESLYGDAVRRDPAKAVALLRQASRAGRPVATHLIRNVQPDAPTPVATK